MPWPHRDVACTMNRLTCKPLVIIFSLAFGLGAVVNGIGGLVHGRFVLVGSGAWHAGQGAPPEQIANVTGGAGVAMSVATALLGLAFVGFAVWLIVSKDGKG